MQVLNNFTFKLVQKVPYSDEAISRIIDKDNRKARMQHSETSDTENLHKLVISIYVPSQYFSGGVSCDFKYKYLNRIPCNLMITSRH